MSKGAIVLKRDGAGRVQTPPERQLALVREFERSGLSGPRFAAMAGVKYQTFVAWRRKHGVRGASRARKARKVTLVEAVVSECSSQPAAACGKAEVVIELPAGAKLRLQSTAQIPLASALLNALHNPLPC